MQISRSKIFVKNYKKLSPEIQKSFCKQFKLFLESKKHPSLQVKKIKGTVNIFEVRVTKSCRFTFCIIDNVLILRKIGEYDKVLKNP